MEPKEIRIGNMLRWKDNGQQFDVMMANMADHYFWNHLAHGDIDGIPLTPEILEKCGFKRANSIVWVREDDFCIADHYDENDMLVHDKYSLSFITISHDDEIVFEYLHQLQNLYFALYGEELQIQL